jgi:hypothetical protein
MFLMLLIAQDVLARRDGDHKIGDCSAIGIRSRCRSARPVAAAENCSAYRNGERMLHVPLSIGAAKRLSAA